MVKEEEKSDLQRSDERIRSFIEKSAIAIYCFELERPIDISLPIKDQLDLIYRHAFIAEANDIYAKLACFERGEDMKGLHLSQIMPRELPENVSQLKRLIRANYSLTNVESIEVYPNGTERIFLNNVVGIIEDGGLIRAWGTGLDITQLRTAEKKLKVAEQRYRTVADFTYDWEYWESPEGKMLYVSPSCERISGYHTEAFRDNPDLIKEIILDEDRGIWAEHWHNVKSNAAPSEIEFRIHSKNGEIRWIEHACQPVHDSDGTYLGIRASNRDITDRKKAERALVSSESSLRAFIDNTEDMICARDREGALIFWNEAFNKSCKRLFGVEACGGLRTGDLVPPEQREKTQHIRELWKRVFKGERVRGEFAYTWPNGENHFFETSWSPIQIGDEIIGAAEITRDITERKLAEDELKKKDKMLENAQRIARLGSWDWDILTNELKWSDEVLRIFGLSSQNFGATYDAFLESVHPDDREDVKKAVNRALSDASFNYNITHRIKRPDSSERLVRERGKVTFDDNTGKASRMIGTVQDITDVRKMEMETERLRAELSRMDRVSIMGALTAGIAHEINQPLAAILSNAQAALRFMNSDPQELEEVEEALRDIISDDKRAGEMVHSIRNIVGKYDLKREEIDLNKTVREALPLVKSEALKSNIVISEDLQADVPPVYGDRIQIQQVTLNLVMNALEALKGHRTSTHEVIVSTRFGDNKEVLLSVSDSGPGIEPERLNTIFDSFETTKKEGLGIGLSICRSIADKHGGQLWAENRPEGGAIFFFSLPLSG